MQWHKLALDLRVCSNQKLERFLGFFMADQTELVTTIKGICDGFWNENNSPVLLSALPPLLKGKVPDFRTILGDGSLKSFIKQTQVIGGYKLVEHPTQHARVGLVPENIDFEFPAMPTLSSGPVTSKANQEATLSFLRALSTLPSSDLEKVIIPTSVLIKLLK